MLAAIAAIIALSVIPSAASAAPGRVVTLGDSMASGMKLGPQLQGSILACGQTTGGYPELVRARLGLTSPSNPLTTAGNWANASCNGGFADLFNNSWTGIPHQPPYQYNDGTRIPAQYNSLSGSEQAVVLGTGGNEAYFGEVVDKCLGYVPSIQNPSLNNCIATYGADGSGLKSKVAISKTKVAQALDAIRAKSPNAKVLLVGIPRITPANGIDPTTGATCMPNPILTAADAPVFAIWEEELRTAMKQITAARSPWAQYVDMQAISGDKHSMCAQTWAQRWINPWSTENSTYPGIALHNTPAGASATANAIIDSLHAAGIDTGTQQDNPTKPVVTISSPASGLITRNAATTINFSATDNVAIDSCTTASGSSVNLNPGSNTITVTCQDHAGNQGTASVAVTRDNAPPTITITAPANNSNTTASSAVLSYSASDNVGSPSCSPASGSSAALIVGSNTLTVNCTDVAGNSATATVNVNRGNVPAVAIISPSDGFSTTAANVNVAFTVGGSPVIPGGTTCTVGGSPTSSASTNAFNLQLGNNAIAVVCTNQFGSSPPASVNVTGAPPAAVAITAPVEGANTTSPSVNVAYTVNGNSTIPNGTSCTVNGASSSTPQTNNVSLALGSNAITVNCIGAFGSKSATVSVNRGNPPVVAIASPAAGAKTAQASINVAFTVGGSSAIPAGTGCTVAGVATASATSNSVALAVGANTITVVCTNQFGQGPAANVSVTRGTAPVVAITTPANNTNTTASQLNLSYTVGGSATIPVGTSCSVGGASSSSPNTNNVALAIGANNVAVTCTNEFGDSAPQSVTINRGSIPSVMITAPANNTNTAASSINVSYTVDGNNSVPSGTSCTVKGSPSSSTTSNAVSLALGSNTIAVTCTNAFGSSTSAAVNVNRGPVPTVAITSPANNTNTVASQINVAFTVNSSATIPVGMTCNVDEITTTSTAINQVALAMGANSVSVVCRNAFGPSAPVSVTINRGTVPAVEVITPTNDTITSASSVNVSYTVDGTSSIPAGTTCKVGVDSSTSTTSNSAPLALGQNTVTVTCENAFGSGSRSVSVTRGLGPIVVITAPVNGSKTTQSQTSVSFTVNGSSSIPFGTTCRVGGQATSSTSGNLVPLGLGSNAVSVTCNSILGSDTKSVTVERGTPPALTIAEPIDGANTTSANITLAFSVAGSGAPTCTVNGNSASSPLSVQLVTGENAILVACTSDFGSDSRAITVNRGTVPVVLINADLNTETPAKTVNASYMVDGAAAIPAGHECSVNGTPSTNTEINAVDLTPGENTVVVKCTNRFGEGTARVFVTYTPPPVAPEPPAPKDPRVEEASTITVKLNGKTKMRPAARGGMLIAPSASSGLPIKVTLDGPASVNLRVERVRPGRSAAVKLAGRVTLALPAGSAKLHFSGRVSNRALPAGRYRLSVDVPGTKLRALSESFLVTR